MANSGWIGCDLDATLAQYDGFKGPTVIGEPILAMVNRVKAWIAKGYEVRIMTARVWAPSIYDTSMTPDEFGKRIAEARHARRAIEDWTELHIGKRLEVTCQKDFSMWVLYDDRCRQVEPNTGRLLGDIGVKDQLSDKVKAITSSFAGIHFTLEEAYKIKAAVDAATEYPKSEEKKVIWRGAEIAQSISIPVQKVFVHPFTLANIMSKGTQFEDVFVGGEPDPLTAIEQDCLDRLDTNRKALDAHNARTT